MLANIITPFAWPLVVAFGMFLFRRSISGFINRATRFTAGPTGAAVEAAARAEQQIEATKPPETATLPPPPPPGGSILRPPDPIPLYDRFDADLRARLNHVFGDRTELKLDWAIRENSRALVERMHETNYRVIFSSQIWALKRLNEIGQTTLSQGRKVYDAAAKQNPHFYSLVTFESWSTFLRNSRYVQIGEGDDPIVTLTPVGKDFLVWMVARGVPEVKPY